MSNTILNTCINTYNANKADVPMLKDISFHQAFYLQLQFLDNPQGLLENNIDSCLTDDCFSEITLKQSDQMRYSNPFPENQLSPELADALSNNPISLMGHKHTDKLKLIILNERLIDIIMKLGDIEHTGDWDPYLHIKLLPGSKQAIEKYNNATDNLDEYFANDDTEFTSSSGYPEYTVHTEDGIEYIKVINQDPDDDFEFATNIPIYLITEIKVYF